MKIQIGVPNSRALAIWEEFAGHPWSAHATKRWDQMVGHMQSLTVFSSWSSYYLYKWEAFAGDTWEKLAGSPAPWAAFKNDAWNSYRTRTWNEISRGKRNLWKKNSLQTTNAIEERSTLRFQIVDKSSAWHFREGQPIEVRDELDDIIFAGFINSSEEVPAGGISRMITHSLECKDLHYLADKRRIVAGYVNRTGGYIVRDILKTYLGPEGVIEGLIQDGEVIPEISFNLLTIAEALDKLAERCGFTWFIAEDHRLYFIDRITYPAPWDAVASSPDILEASVVRASDNYRNTQYIQGGKEETSLQTNYKVGDGESKSFTFGYRIARGQSQPNTAKGLPGDQPRIYIQYASDGAWIEQDVNIKGTTRTANSTWTWEWAKDDNTIVQVAGEPLSKGDPTARPPILPDRLKIEYIGFFDVLAVSTDYSALMERQDLEAGGTGIVESVASEPSLTSTASAIASANAKLSKYTLPGITLTYKTRRNDGIAAGQIQKCYFPQFNLNGDEHLIISDEVSEQDGILYHTITAVIGPNNGSWEKFFTDLTKAKRNEAISGTQSAILTIATVFIKQWQESDLPNMFLEVFPGESITPSSLNWPCFAAEDRVRYVVLYTNGQEFYRHQVAKVTQDLKQIHTMDIIPSGDANDIPISHVGLWGGASCSDLPGSGVELYKVPYVKTKNYLEALQLQFTDNMWPGGSLGVLMGSDGRVKPASAMYTAQAVIQSTKIPGATY